VGVAALIELFLFIFFPSSGLSFATTFITANLFGKGYASTHLTILKLIYLIKQRMQKNRRAQKRAGLCIRAVHELARKMLKSLNLSLRKKSCA